MDELTDAQLAELQSDLLTLSDELRSLLVATVEAASPVDLDQPIGRLSRMDAMQQQQMVEAQRRRAELRIKQIAVALNTYDEEEYGWCKKCGEAIGYPRLKARPESPCCVPCMREVEAATPG